MSPTRTPAVGGSNPGKCLEDIHESLAVVDQGPHAVTVTSISSACLVTDTYTPQTKPTANATIHAPEPTYVNLSESYSTMYHDELSSLNMVHTPSWALQHAQTCEVKRHQLL